MYTHIWSDPPLGDGDRLLCVRLETILGEDPNIIIVILIKLVIVMVIVLVVVIVVIVIVVHPRRGSYSRPGCSIPCQTSISAPD